ncbi:ATP-binding protein [Oribacterium sp. WCC10]|uniref:ATP-binding protein n=1 Tax=Oribacterium sp. WCC10 TaxID=1855343 RepID=UPI0008F25C64|nr:ATP-binding protein [Oribacterium sp. WCC10]SFG53606.1 Anti-sigma regulatory factor (Ser/Thr protein kinase) [Oribacterium sp. WCC10]
MNVNEIDKREFCVDAEISELDSVLDFVNEYLEELGCSMGLTMKIDVAVEEIFVNIAHYAYKKINPDLKGNAWISISKNETGDRVQIGFRDKGIAYNPLEKEDPDTTLDAEDREIGGLGIFMVKKSMDDILYERTGDENFLMLIKKII